MKFEEIFKEDGYYYSDDFVEGFCFQIYDGVLRGVQFENKDDFLPQRDNHITYRGLFAKEYHKLLNKGQLFRNQGK